MSTAKQDILAAASRLFLAGGIAALSVRAIAKEAGVSTIGIYSHFSGKQGILDMLYIEGFKLVAAAMNVDASDLSPRDAVIKGVEGYLHMAVTHEAHYRLIFGENEERYTPSEDASAAAKSTFQHLVDRCSRLLPANARAELAQSTALEIWAFVHGYVSLRHHAIAATMSTEKWNAMATKALTTHIDAVITSHSK